MMSLSELIPHMFPDKTSVPLDQPPAKMSPPVLPTKKVQLCHRLLQRIVRVRQLSLLESFAGIKMSSFGNYVEKAINQDGFFAEKIDFPMTLGDNCGDMQEFARKAVSYSREIDSIIFNCRCRVGVKIAKIK
uniref:Uncharacterized protein n=1 Tax=Ditylenchus dipsaci TaxID=166011 RepID=A0A915D597_9BILA